MDKILLSRRAALSALAALAVAPSAAWAAPAATRFREIRLNVSPMLAKDEDEFASWVAAALPGYLNQTFAKYLAPGDRGAAVLVARVDHVIVGPPYQHSGSNGPTTSDTTDWIEGAGVVLDASGRTIGTYPLMSSINVDSQQRSPYQAEIIRRRVETLALSFAQWLPGQMGL
ncbi:MAG: hypothetical protein WAU78_02780 [Roseiarcus sp.]|jgi:hypothetical protein